MKIITNKVIKYSPSRQLLINGYCLRCHYIIRNFSSQAGLDVWHGATNQCSICKPGSTSVASFYALAHAQMVCLSQAGYDCCQFCDQIVGVESTVTLMNGN
jgi:hypothetical protein